MLMTPNLIASAERSRIELKQDKDVPLLINIKDGRLVPNVKNTRENPDYRPYSGNPHADLRTRMMALSVGVGSGVRIIASKPIIDTETFDVSTATKDELIVFAFDEFSLELEPTTHIATMRKQIMAANERMSAKTPQGDDLS